MTEPASMQPAEPPAFASMSSATVRMPSLIDQAVGLLLDSEGAPINDDYQTGMLMSLLQDNASQDPERHVVIPPEMLLNGPLQEAFSGKSFGEFLRWLGGNILYLEAQGVMAIVNGNEDQFASDAYVSGTLFPAVGATMVHFVEVEPITDDDNDDSMSVLLHHGNMQEAQTPLFALALLGAGEQQQMNIEGPVSEE